GSAAADPTPTRRPAALPPNHPYSNTRHRSAHALPAASTRRANLSGGAPRSYGPAPAAPGALGSGHAPPPLGRRGAGDPESTGPRARSQVGDRQTLGG